jgi:hypothetical protein
MNLSGMDLLGLDLLGAVQENGSAVLDGCPNRVEPSFRGQSTAKNAAPREQDGV